MTYRGEGFVFQFDYLRIINSAVLTIKKLGRVLTLRDYAFSIGAFPVRRLLGHTNSNKDFISETNEE